MQPRHHMFFGQRNAKRGQKPKSNEEFDRIISSRSSNFTFVSKGDVIRLAQLRGKDTI